MLQKRADEGGNNEMKAVSITRKDVQRISVDSFDFVVRWGMRPLLDE